MNYITVLGLSRRRRVQKRTGRRMSKLSAATSCAFHTILYPAYAAGSGAAALPPALRPWSDNRRGPENVENARQRRRPLRANREPTASMPAAISCCATFPDYDNVPISAIKRLTAAYNNELVDQLGNSGSSPAGSRFGRNSKATCRLRPRPNSKPTGNLDRGISINLFERLPFWTRL